MSQVYRTWQFISFKLLQKRFRPLDTGSFATTKYNVQLFSIALFSFYKALLARSILLNHLVNFRTWDPFINLTILIIVITDNQFLAPDSTSSSKCLLQPARAIDRLETGRRSPTDRNIPVPVRSYPDGGPEDSSPPSHFGLGVSVLAELNIQRTTPTLTSSGGDRFGIPLRPHQNNKGD